MFMIISHTKRYLKKNYILYFKKKLLNIEHHLVLIVEITCPQANKQTNTRHTEKISRSDLTVRLKTHGQTWLSRCRNKMNFYITFIKGKNEQQVKFSAKSLGNLLDPCYWSKTSEIQNNSTYSVVELVLLSSTCPF